MLKKLLVGKTDSGKAQFLRSILVSNVSFALDFCVCLLLVGRLRLNYLAATALSFTAGTALNYALSVLWVFDERPVDNRRLEFGFYLFIAALGLGLNALSMLCAAGLGAASSLEEAASLVPIARVDEPDGSNKAIYDEHYEVLKQLYYQNKESFARLNRSRETN